MWASGELVGALVFVALFIQWSRADEREAVRTDRRLDRSRVGAAAIRASRTISGAGSSGAGRPGRVQRALGCVGRRGSTDRRPRRRGRRRRSSPLRLTKTERLGCQVATPLISPRPGRPAGQPGRAADRRVVGVLGVLDHELYRHSGSRKASALRRRSGTARHARSPCRGRAVRVLVQAAQLERRDRRARRPRSITGVLDRRPGGRARRGRRRPGRAR